MNKLNPRRLRAIVCAARGGLVSTPVESPAPAQMSNELARLCELPQPRPGYLGPGLR